VSIKLSTEDARWGVREAAWSFEERVLWRASDSGRSALRRALRAIQPLQRLIQTKLVWPLGDRLEDYGTGARTALATLGVVAAVGAAFAGSRLAVDSEAPAQPLTASALVAETSGEATSLRGVTPDFARDATGAAASVAVKPAPPPSGADAAGADAPPDQIAWRFAQAFVAYEVGKVDKEDVTAFQATATGPLADSLGTDPPRLPAGTKVPQAKVLNVVPGAQTGKEMVVSVSLLRLEAASELRLTLRESKKGWRVAGVLG
jgi:hypothetical protein